MLLYCYCLSDMVANGVVNRITQREVDNEAKLWRDYYTDKAKSIQTGVAQQSVLSAIRNNRVICIQSLGEVSNNLLDLSWQRFIYFTASNAILVIVGWRLFGNRRKT